MKEGAAQGAREIMKDDHVTQAEVESKGFDTICDREWAGFWIKANESDLSAAEVLTIAREVFADEN
jgi:hypothetical protein